jgi:hypothetical protein
MTAIFKNFALKGCVLGGLFLSLNTLGFSAESKTKSKQESAVEDWKKIESKQGKCSMAFPSDTQHVAETMKIDEDGTELKYDAYIAASEKETVFMLLVAEYPDFMDDDFAEMSLESFLNGILDHGSNTQLLFADLVLVQGHQAMDFFIKTGANYFKGRAMMVKNQLYLMAMECKVSDYNEAHYNKFIDSFLLRH